MSEYSGFIYGSDAVVRELRKSSNVVLKAFGGHIFEVARIVEKIRKHDEGDSKLTTFDYDAISELVGVSAITSEVYDTLEYLRKTLDELEMQLLRQVKP